MISDLWLLTEGSTFLYGSKIVHQLFNCNFVRFHSFVPCRWFQSAVRVLPPSVTPSNCLISWVYMYLVHCFCWCLSAAFNVYYITPVYKQTYLNHSQLPQHIGREWSLCTSSQPGNVHTLKRYQHYTSQSID